MAKANLALRLLLELAGVLAVGYWGYHAVDGLGSWVVAIGGPAFLVVFWALVIAPGADVPIPPRTRELAGSVVLLVAALALYAAGARAAALVLAGLIILNTLLTLVLRD